MKPLYWGFIFLGPGFIEIAVLQMQKMTLLSKLCLPMLLLLCLSAFLPGINGPFLHDDFPNLKMVQVGPFNLESALDVMTRNSTGPLKRPISNLTLAGNYWLHGLKPFGFKLFNLVLHGLVGFVAYLLAKEMLRAFAMYESAPDSPRRLEFAALTTMVIWTIHPLQVSTALYVVQRMAQLSALFSLLAIYFVLRWVNSARWNSADLIKCFLLYVSCTLLALGSKENGALTPLLVGVVLFFWKLRQTSVPSTREGYLSAFVWLGVLVPIFAGLLFAAIHPETIIGGYQNREFTLIDRLSTQPIVLWFYLKLFFIPNIHWMGLYHDDFLIYQIASAKFWLSIVGFISTIAFGLFYRRFMMMSFAMSWFLAAHALESSILPLEMVYEHRNYAALFGPALLVGHMASIFSVNVYFRRLGWIIPALVLAGLTIKRSHSWSSYDAFATSEYSNHPGAPRAMLLESARAITLKKKAYADELVGRMQSARPNDVWVHLLGANLQCFYKGYRVDWKKIDVALNAQVKDAKVLSIAHSVMEGVMGNGCMYLEIEQFERFLERGYYMSLFRGDAAVEAEMFAKYRGWLANKRKDQLAQALWFERSIRANPSGIEPLIEYAYLMLNSGELDSVPPLIKELRARRDKYKLPINYRIDEIENFYLDDLRKAHKSS